MAQLQPSLSGRIQADINTAQAQADLSISTFASIQL